MAFTRPLQRGETVRVRDERWRVVHVTSHGACAVVELAGLERSNAGRAGRFILPFEPLARLPSASERPRVVRPAVWRRVARTALADVTPAWDSLRAAARANIDLLPYQLEPVMAMIRGLACRFLLADEVGLGKTIQAGLLIAELLAREPEARVMIVTPASLRDQWREELQERFAIEAAVIDAVALVRAAAVLPEGVNPWAIPSVAIASIDYLKRADVIRSLEPLAWDLVAFDEAHALCGKSDRAIAADLVAARARRVVIITATPHSGDEAAFERLRALGRVGTGDRSLTFRRSRIEAGIPRSRVARQLSVSPTPTEARMHRALVSYGARVATNVPAESAASARLAMIVLARRACSSAESLARSIERRIALLGSAEPLESQLRLPLDEGHLTDDEEPIDELAAPGLSDGAAEQRILQEILALARAVSVESKISVLRRLLRRAAQPVLVFTEYRDTLQHIAAVLDTDAALLHGGLTTTERAREARRFTHGNASLMLATDAASEGLNLQHRCRLVVNLDVPWSPVRLEQRIGRVDRIGQRRRVHGVTLVARGTTEARVASALSSRSRRAERDAPFGPGSGDVALHEAAIAEASRLTGVRLLASPTPALSAPLLTVLGRKPREARTPHLTLALRLLFVDATGAIVWDTIRGFVFASCAPSDFRAAALRAWFEREVRQHTSSLVAVSRLVHEKELAALQRSMSAAISPLLERERAMLQRLDSGKARLAAPLLQPGLFDRRAIRDAEARRRVAEEARARSEDRIHALERCFDVQAGDRCLVFAVTRSR